MVRLWNFLRLLQSYLRDPEPLMLLIAAYATVAGNYGSEHRT